MTQQEEQNIVMGHILLKLKDREPTEENMQEVFQTEFTLRELMDIVPSFREKMLEGVKLTLDDILGNTNDNR